MLASHVRALCTLCLASRSDPQRGKVQVYACVAVVCLSARHRLASVHIKCLFVCVFSRSHLDGPAAQLRPTHKTRRVARALRFAGHKQTQSTRHSRPAEKEERKKTNAHMTHIIMIASPFAMLRWACARLFVSMCSTTPSLPSLRFASVIFSAVLWTQKHTWKCHTLHTR